MARTLHITLTNRTGTFAPGSDLKDLEPWYSFRPPGYHFAPSYQRGYWDGRIRLLRGLRVPAGLFRATRREIERDLGIHFQIERRLKEIAFQEGAASDRDYQNACIAAMLAKSRHGGGLVIAGTGIGKTRTVGLFLYRVVGSSCFVVDELTLLDQARKEIAGVTKEEVGMVGDQTFAPRRLTVATIQTMHKHRHRPEFQAWARALKVLVLDEVHLALSKRNRDVVEQLKPPAVFGLTATLELRKKDVRTRAFALCGPVVFEYDLQQGVADGYLAGGVVRQVRVPITFPARVPYPRAYEAVVTQSDTRNNVVEALVRESLRRGKYVIVLVERIAHVEELDRRLQDVFHGLAWGRASAENRIHTKSKFELGEIRLILANKVFKKGVDIRRVDVVIDAAGMKSKNDALQKYGRGVRLSQGKTGLIYLDIGDVGNRLEGAGKSRYRAFGSKSLPRKRVDWKVTSDPASLRAQAREVLDEAQRALDVVIRNWKGREREQNGRERKGSVK